MKLGRLAGLFTPVRKQTIPSAAEAARTAALFENLGNPGFVTLAYQVILHRVADAAGYNHFLSRLDRKEMTRADAVRTIIDSDEFRLRCLTLFDILHRSRKEIIRQL